MTAPVTTHIILLFWVLCEWNISNFFNFRVSHSSPNTIYDAFTWAWPVLIALSAHMLPRTFSAVGEDLCVFYLFVLGRKRRMVRFLAHSTVQRPPLSSLVWVQDRSTRSNWRWWKTTSVGRLPPKMSSQVSAHILILFWLKHLEAHKDTNLCAHAVMSLY